MLCESSQMAAEEIEALKEDKPFTDDGYIWTHLPGLFHALNPR